MVTNEATVALALREALRPLWRRLNAQKTLSTGKLGVLAYLAEHGAATSSTLASVERISPQAIATAVRELEGLGLITRTPDDQDRRRVWIDLTDAGRERLALERSTGNSWLEQAVSERLTAEERELLKSVVPLLQKLTVDTPRA
ncbi:MarR family winged helix-turn-helix transcriptional regulator [Nocardia carnea]|uniref:MarR family winged helix-turn-helix transcriptional regulator n=1 Tax=Nocardia carnea TaxID=37328 RepID=A0ABW7TVV0_9NOCA|nr:MarR family transcriptional regulator [Nocardia carnea]